MERPKSVANPSPFANIDLHALQVPAQAAQRAARQAYLCVLHGADTIIPNHPVPRPSLPRLRLDEVF